MQLGFLSCAMLDFSQSISYIGLIVHSRAGLDAARA